jgi:hypothetical protein
MPKKEGRFSFEKFYLKKSEESMGVIIKEKRKVLF